MIFGKLRTQIAALVFKLGFLSVVVFPTLAIADLQEDFYALMGRKQAVWQFLLQEDKNQLDRFAQVFNETLRRPLLLKSSIPTKIHFIWVGPKEFPSESLKNVYSWIEKHPEFEIYFWSDRERVLPHTSMQLRLVSDFKWLFLKELFLDSNNYAEQSDLLRYEILYQEGGVYVDHDVECFKPFTQFVNLFDLFCGLEFPHKPIAETSITVCNNIIGAHPKHPILKKTIEMVLEKWNKYKKLYPGMDADSITKRVYYRTFASFDDAVKMMLSSDSEQNIAFPAGYFNKLGKHLGLYAHHQYANTWFEKESLFEKNVRQKLVKICKKNNQIMLIAFAIFVLIFSIICALFIQLRALRKQLECFYHKDKT